MLEGAPVSVRAFCLQDWTSWEAFIVALHLKQAGGEGWARESAALEGVRSPLVAAMLAEEAWCDCAQLGTAQRKLVHSLLERRELISTLTTPSGVQSGEHIGQVRWQAIKSTYNCISKSRAEPRSRL